MFRRGVSGIHKLYMRGLRHRQNAAGSHTSEEDALLDLEIQRAIQAEYGHVEPPTGIFNKVMHAIKAHDRRKAAQGQRRAIPALFAEMKLFFWSLGKRTTGLVSSRLMPSVVAVALLLIFTGTNIQRLLIENSRSGIEYTGRTATAPYATAESLAGTPEAIDLYERNMQRYAQNSTVAFNDPTDLVDPRRSYRASSDNADQSNSEQERERHRRYLTSEPY